jgi:hypothetical protein
MLTSYWVSCPHSGCHWFGSLLPQNDVEAWHGAVPVRGVVVFQCPHCHGEWRAQMVGEDVVPLPLEEISAPWA